MYKLLSKLFDTWKISTLNMSLIKLKNKKKNARKKYLNDTLKTGSIDWPKIVIFFITYRR